MWPLNCFFVMMWPLTLQSLALVCPLVLELLLRHDVALDFAELGLGVSAPGPDLGTVPHLAHGPGLALLGHLLGSAGLAGGLGGLGLGRLANGLPRGSPGGTPGGALGGAGLGGFTGDGLDGHFSVGLRVSEVSQEV